MTPLFKKIGLAIAFSPRVEAMLAETIRLKNTWEAELVLIHVGEHGETEERKLNQLLQKHNLTLQDVTLDWRSGKPSREILKACEEHKIDLLVTGALRKEGLLQHHVSSIARRILRKANCSVLTLIQPSISPQPYSSIVVHAEESPRLFSTLSVACWLARVDKVKWLHVAREIRFYGLTMTTAEQATEGEYSKLKHDLIEGEIDNLQKTLNKIPHNEIKINIKIFSGRSGFEIAQFAKRKHADLLVIEGPARRLSFFDRIFTHELEYLLTDLPCNLLIVHRQFKAQEVLHA